MFSPILSAFLCAAKMNLAVRWWNECIRWKSASRRNDEHSETILRNPIVSSIHQAPRNVVLGGVSDGTLLSSYASIMGLPQLRRSRPYRRTLELAQNVLKIILKPIAQEAADILDQDGNGTEFADGTEYFREEIATVLRCAVFSAKTKWLTRGASSKQSNFFPKARPFHSFDVLFNNDPSEARPFRFEIMPKRLTSPGVLLVQM